MRQTTHIARVLSSFADAHKGRGKPATTAKAGWRAPCSSRSACMRNSLNGKVALITAHRRGLVLPHRTSWPLGVCDSSSLADAGPRSRTPHARLGAAPLASRPTCRTSRISTGFTNRSRGTQVASTWCSRTPGGRRHAPARDHHRGARRPDLRNEREGIDRWAEGNRELQRVQRDQSRSFSNSPAQSRWAVLATPRRWRRPSLSSRLRTRAS